MLPKWVVAAPLAALLAAIAGFVLAVNGGETRAPAAGHWAFQPVVRPVAPMVSGPVRSVISEPVSSKSRRPEVASNPNHPIDAFITQRLLERGLRMAPTADRRTLIRRASFDLTGLPPTPEEVEAFLADRSPEAFAAVVDRLLASPRYGERWGRHWLDVARYSDTKGYVRLKDNPNYVGAWAYRDYVIRAFNEDKPYHQFVLEQLAADQLPSGEADPRALAAMGFLTLGQRFINSQPDIIDDRIDVVTRGLLGLTVACARCHDHKYDPIPTRDYYSLYGVFDSSVEPRVPPIAATGQDLPAGYREEFQERTRKFEAFLQTQRSRLKESFRARAADYLLAAQKEKVQPNFLAAMFLIDAAKDLNPVMVHRLALFLERTRKEPHPIMAVWHALAQLPEDGFANAAAVKLDRFRSDAAALQPVNRLVVEALQTRPPRSLADVAGRWAELLQEAERRGQKNSRGDLAAARLEDAAWEEIRQLLHGTDAPFDVPVAVLEEYFYVDATTQNQLHEEQRRVEDWISTNALAPHAHILMDAPVPREPRVFLRGNASNPGEAVPRQFLSVLTAGPCAPFKHGSGRLELAQAIASTNNPLTARVLVNRVWLHHFGAGLVRTPADFGTRGDPPTHPELLDYLASRFMVDGWSVKKLHCLIMHSATYQQRSAETLEGRRRDPANTLFGRMNRRRLDWESLRDSLLSVSGTLDLRMGGPSVKLAAGLGSTRRTVYGFVDRQNLPAVFRTFDFASPDACAAQRHQTSLAQQSLFLMNSPFLKEQAVRLAGRAEARFANLEDRVDGLHRLLYGRPAEAGEIGFAKAFLDAAQPVDSDTTPGDAADPHLTPWQEYAQTLLLANEFVFID